MKIPPQRAETATRETAMKDARRVRDIILDVLEHNACSCIDTEVLAARLMEALSGAQMPGVETSEQMLISRDEDKSTDQLILEILESLMRGGCWCLLTKASSHSPDCERARAAVERLRRKCAEERSRDAHAQTVVSRGAWYPFVPPVLAEERAEQPSAHEHQWVDVTEYWHVERHFRCAVPFCGARKTEPIE